LYFSGKSKLQSKKRKLFSASATTAYTGTWNKCRQFISVAV